MSNAAALIQSQIQKYLKDPLVPLELTGILNKLRDPECSSDAFKSEYKRDPILSWYLITAAANKTRTKINHPFAADHSMSTLGISEAEKLFSPLKSIERKPLSDEVKFYLSASLLAAELAQQIAPFAHGHAQAYWTALYYNLPDTLLWFLQPRHMWRIFYRQLTIPRKQGLFEESKLGFNLFEWRQAVAKAFELSEQNKLLFTKPLPGNPKELLAYRMKGLTDDSPSLKQWHQQEAWLVVLANRLARAILAPWNATAFQHIFKMIQQLAHCDDRKLFHAVNDSVRKVSDNIADTCLFTPAVNYLLIRGKPAYPEAIIRPQADIKKRVRKVTAQTGVNHAYQNPENQHSTSRQPFLKQSDLKQSASKQPPPSKTKKQVPVAEQEPTRLKSVQQPVEPSRLSPIKTTEYEFNQPDSNSKEETEKLARRLIQKACEFDSSSSLVQAALKGIISILGYERASFLLVNYKSSLAQTRLAISAKAKNSIHPDFNFKQPGPLSRFVEKQSFLCFSREQHQKIWRKLPEIIQRKQVERFALCSLKSGNKVSALIYVDSNNVERYKPENLTHLKLLLKALNKGLNIRSEAKKQNGQLSQKKA